MKQIFIKKEAEGEFGKSPKERTTEELIDYGIVNIDKPKGPTSHQTSDYVKKILKIKKAGHSGTLDPAVTGVQPVALGKATRITQFLLTAPKEYVCLMHLHQEVEEEKIRNTTEQFIGKIQQLPPIKSAVKRELRTREIYEFEILEINGKDVLFRVRCQAGTYIRKLCLHPQTEILTKEGLMNASNFYSNHPSIYSFSNGKMIEKNPSATQKLPSPSKLIKFNMASGISFIVTPDHEMLTSKKEGYKMVEAQELKKGDYLVKSRVFPEVNKDFVIADLLDDDYYIQQQEIKDKCKQAFISKYSSIRAMCRKLKLDRKVFLSKSNHAITIKHLKLAGIYVDVKKNIHTFKTQKGNIITLDKLNEDFFYLLGLIASDGNNTKEKKTVRHTRIKFHNNEETLIEKFLDTYKKIFPSIPISKRKITPKLWELDSTNSFLATISASLGIKSPQKNSDILPIVNAKPKLLKSFIRGYFDGDGSVYYKKTASNHKTKICLHTINRIDAIRLHEILLKIGISNKIFQRNVKSSTFRKDNHLNFEVSVGNIPDEKKFISEIGTNHPKKAEKFKKIVSLKYDANPGSHCYVGLHFKEEIRNKKSKLYEIGGNLNRVLTSNIPLTKGFYKKASKMVKLPKLDEFVIERIKSVELVKETNYVYDMTVPDTHNFLIETGFVSSNCHDLGKKLEAGAHMAELRRTQAGPFTEKDNLVTLNDLQDAFHFYKEENNDKFLMHCIQPIENALKHISKCWIFDTTIESVSHGRDVGIPGISKLENFKKGETVAILTLKDELVAIGEALMSAVEINTKEKGLGIKTKKVFIDTI